MDKSTPCFGCNSGGSLDIGPGAFRDFDSDLADGIPVCGGCGGTGLTIDSSEFRKSAESIMNARFAFTPMVADSKRNYTWFNSDLIPASERVKMLINLRNEILSHHKIYGGVEGCFAEQLRDISIVSSNLFNLTARAVACSKLPNSHKYTEEQLYTLANKLAETKNEDSSVLNTPRVNLDIFSLTNHSYACGDVNIRFGDFRLERGGEREIPSGERLFRELGKRTGYKFEGIETRMLGDIYLAKVKINENRESLPVKVVLCSENAISQS